MAAARKRTRKVTQEAVTPDEAPVEASVEAPPARERRKGIAPYKVRPPDSRSVRRRLHYQSGNR